MLERGSAGYTFAAFSVIFGSAGYTAASEQGLAKEKTPEREPQTTVG